MSLTREQRDELRVEHRERYATHMHGEPLPKEIDQGPPWCYRCRDDWPCNVAKMLDALDAAEAVLDRNLCFKHRETTGLFGYHEGDCTTPTGGGCIVTIVERAEMERDAAEARIAELEAANRDLLEAVGLEAAERWKS